MNSNYYCVIMAGGIGSRFWPLSTTDRPKQFLDILNVGKSLLQQTFDRFTKILPPENIIIVTNDKYTDLVLEQLPALTKDQVLGEPMRRNTAPCIAYANYKILKQNPEAQIVVAPSDHVIEKEKAFIEVLKKGLEYVSKNDILLTLGIQPSRPETGYGYIQVNGNDEKIILNESFRTVKTFTEKPDHKMANVFYESGDFFWNSGMFFWSLKTIMNAFKNYLPEVDALFKEGMDKYNTPEEKAFVDNAYPSCRNISIDYGVMEKADNVHVLCSDFGWSDLGTWGSLYERLNKDENGNVSIGDSVFSYDNKNCLVNVPNNKVVVIQGLEDCIVVESDNTLLICKKQDEQKIKNFVNDVKMKKGEEFI